VSKSVGAIGGLTFKKPNLLMIAKSMLKASSTVTSLALGFLPLFFFLPPTYNNDSASLSNFD